MIHQFQINVNWCLYVAAARIHASGVDRQAQETLVQRLLPSSSSEIILALALIKIRDCIQRLCHGLLILLGQK